MDPRYDIHRIEVIDDLTVEAMRRLGGSARIRMASELSEDARALMAGRVRSENPALSAQEISREVARRLLNAAT